MHINGLTFVPTPNESLLAINVRYIVTKVISQKIRLVMRFSGPKMLFKHPLLALLHLYDRRKEPPVDFPKKSKIEENKKIGQMETCPNENQVES